MRRKAEVNSDSWDEFSRGDSHPMSVGGTMSGYQHAPLRRRSFAPSFASSLRTQHLGVPLARGCPACVAPVRFLYGPPRSGRQIHRENLRRHRVSRPGAVHGQHGVRAGRCCRLRRNRATKAGDGTFTHTGREPPPTRERSARRCRRRTER